MAPVRIRQRRWPRRLLRLGVLLLGGSVGSLVLLQSPLFQHWAAESLAALLESLTGESVIIGDLDIAPLAGRVALGGLVISHPGAPPGEGTVAAVERIEVHLTLRHGLERILIERPSIQLHIDPDGLREFRALTQPGADTADDAPPTPPRRHFPWRRLEVREGALSLTAPNNVSVRIPVLNLLLAGDDAELGLPEGARLRANNLQQTLQPVSLVADQVSPAGLLLPGVRLQTEDITLSGAALLQVQGPLRGEFTAEVDLDLLTPALVAQQQLQGTALVDLTVGGRAPAVWVEGALLSEAPVLIRPDRRVPLGSPVTAGWRIEGRQLSVEPLLSHWSRGLVEIRGTVDLVSTGFYASISAEGLDVEEALRQVELAEGPWVGMDADLELQLGGVLNPLSAAGSVEVAGTRLAVAAGPVGDPAQDRLLEVPRLWLEGAVLIDRESFTLAARDLHAGRSRATLGLLMTYGPAGQLSLNAQFAPLDLLDVRPMAGLDLEGRGPASIVVAGPYASLHVDATLRRMRDFSFAGLRLADELSGPVRSPDLRRLLFPGFDALVGSSKYTGDMVLTFAETGPELDLELRLGESRVEDLIGVAVSLEGVTGDVTGTLSLKGPVDAMDGEARLITSGVSLYGETFEDGELIAWIDGNRFTLERLELRRQRGGRPESLFARGSVGRGYVTNLEVLSSGLRLERLDQLQERARIEGRVALDARVGGTLMSLEPQGRLTVRDTRVADRSLGDTAILFETHDGMLSFAGVVAGEGMAVDGTLDLWAGQEYTVHARMDQFPVDAFYPTAPDGSDITARISGEGTLSGDLEGRAPIAAQASVTEAAVAWERHTLRSAEDSPWQFQQSGSTFTLSDVSLADDAGTTALRFGGTRTAEGEVLMAGGGTIELDLLRMMVPGLTRTEGNAEVNISLMRGEGAALSTTVDVAVDQVLVEGTWFPHPVESLSARITAGPEAFVIRDGSGRIGGGALVFGGQIIADGWVPSRYEIDATLTDARVRYLDFLPPLTGDARLSVDGPADDLLLSGDIMVDEMVFSDRIDWESWVLEVSGERLRDAVAGETDDFFSMDLRIQADNTVRMRNNVADLVAGGELRILGDTSRPGMTGTIRAQPGGRVYLKERNFEIQRAELSFVEPYTFDPDVDIAMSTDISARSQSYNIDYRVRGQYSDWYAETSSDPPLSQADINALLLFGLTLEELERYGGLTSALAIEGGDLLASKFGIVERVGDGLFQYDLFRLDRVDLISGVNERSYSAVTSELRLLAEKELDWGGTLRLEQNLNRLNDTYVSLEQRLARKLYLRGFWATDQQGRYLSIGGAYGLDFNLRWELD